MSSIKALGTFSAQPQFAAKFKHKKSGRVIDAQSTASNDTDRVNWFVGTKQLGSIPKQEFLREYTPVNPKGPQTRALLGAIHWERDYSENW